ncbi:MAG TPA: DUF3667 domain-containing protein [Croceibacterium sp.]|nr:DUF3667 domain-containing protein [Croceibacterium sp.]
MTGGIEAVGSLVEGGLLARAVEPAAGEGKGHTHEKSCLNCGTPLIGPHCHECGQHAHIHRTMGAFFHDFAHGVLHFDGKTFRTLPLLAWKPGELTRRYIAGERARFVSPMALFLFSVFLMFAIFQLAGIGPPTDLGPPTQVSAELDLAKSQEYLAQLKAARAKMGKDNPAAPILDVQITGIEKKLGPNAVPKRGDTVVLAQNKAKGTRITSRYTGYPFFDHAIDKWRENPGLMAYKLQSNSYKFSWLLIPLSVPFVWLLFAWRRKFGAYDHAVFVTYSLGFMTLFYVVLVLLGGIGVRTGTLMLLGTVVPLVHIYKQVKGAYGLSRFSAGWRTLALSAFIFVILFLYIDVLLVLGAAD